VRYDIPDGKQPGTCAPSEGLMSKDLMELVLPRLASRLDRQLRRYRAGRLNDDQFTRRFEALLQQQYTWLANQGIPELDAAVAVHGSVVVLSGPGLRAEAAEQGVPLEIVEFKAVLAAAEDIAANYGISVSQAARRISRVVAAYAD
jgi:hypothetical protein